MVNHPIKSFSVCIDAAPQLQALPQVGNCPLVSIWTVLGQHLVDDLTVPRQRVQPFNLTLQTPKATLQKRTYEL